MRSRLCRRYCKVTLAVTRLAPQMTESKLAESAGFVTIAFRGRSCSRHWCREAQRQSSALPSRLLLSGKIVPLTHLGECAKLILEVSTLVQCDLTPSDQAMIVAPCELMRPLSLEEAEWMAVQSAESIRSGHCASSENQCATLIGLGGRATVPALMRADT